MALSCVQRYPSSAAGVHNTNGESALAVRQNNDTRRTTSAPPTGLADYECQYLGALLARLPIRSLADLILVRDGVATIRADIPLHALSLEDACALQGLAGGGRLPVPAPVEPTSKPRRRPVVDGRIQRLTDRQRAVLELLCAGKSNREISATLGGLTEGTVKIHVTAIFKALGADNRTHAVLIAQRLLAGGEG